MAKQPPKRQPAPAKMRPVSARESAAKQNLKEDKMNAARYAINSSSSEKEAIKKLDKGFSEIKPDSTIRKPSGASDARHKYVDVTQKREAGSLKPGGMKTTKKGDPVKKKRG